MPIKDINFHRRGYTNRRRTQLIGGVIQWVPSHPLRFHQDHAVEQTPNVTPSTHQSHEQKRMQVGHGIPINSPYTSSLSGSEDEKIDSEGQEKAFQELMSYCNELDELEPSPSKKQRQDIPSPHIHKASDSDIRFLYM